MDMLAPLEDQLVDESSNRLYDEVAVPVCASLDNWTMTRFLVMLTAISFLLAGCGSGEQKQSKEDRAAMNKEFAQIDFNIAQTTMGPGYPNQKLLKQLTRRYVVVTHKYRDDLGKAEVDRRLTHEAEQVGPHCLPCVEILRREAQAD